MKPYRVRRSRKKGWRMPPNTVYVGRGSRWGNPHKVGVDGKTAQDCVRCYFEDLFPYTHHGARNSLEDLHLSILNLEEAQRDLRGKNLACWCELGEPCHADVLLQIVND